MTEMFHFADGLGPLKIIHINDSAMGLQAVLVVDNISRGPAIGGVRMAEDVTTEECVRLARAMTLKNAAADLPHGGGKIVVKGNPRMDKEKKQRIIRCLAQALKTELTYIFGPDMGTNEECMAWVWDEIGRAVGLPREFGGIPLDVIGATGWGLAHSADVAMEFSGLSIDGARISVQGFGAVGINAARHLVSRGATLVAVEDSRGAIHNPQGLDVESLCNLKAGGESVASYQAGETLSHEEYLGADCDIWIPAARPDVIHRDNARLLNTRLVVQGANIPITEEAEVMLHERGITCIPDFIANAGGVICAAMEYHGSSESAAMDTIRDKLRHNTETVLNMARDGNILPREAAFKLAEERVRAAMGYRRWSTFSTGPAYL